jgi:hypothetical protein
MHPAFSYRAVPPCDGGKQRVCSPYKDVCVREKRETIDQQQQKCWQTGVFLQASFSTNLQQRHQVDEPGRPVKLQPEQLQTPHSTSRLHSSVSTSAGQGGIINGSCVTTRDRE